MEPEKVLTLLQICDLSNQWPELRAIHDKAMAALRKEAEEPSHPAPKVGNGPRMRPVTNE